MPRPGRLTKDELEQMRQEAIVRQARERLSRIEEIRAAQDLARTKRSQRDIAAILRTTQPRVQRMLQATPAPPTDDPSPEELILRATVEGAPREQLVRMLATKDYTFRRHAPGSFEGARPGSWDQVRDARRAGLLSAEEFARVRSAVNPPPAR